MKKKEISIFVILAFLATIIVAGCDTAGTHNCDVPGLSGKSPALKVFNFSEFQVGTLPPDFSTALTGQGGPVSWVVQEDRTAPGGKRVLAQTSSDPANHRFPLCVYDGLSARDIDVSVQFKAVSGMVDQAAGVIVRYQNQDNYYIARANALENNVRFYKVENGRRSQIAGINAEVSSGRWHTLKLNAKGEHFVVKYDDKLFETDDSTFQKPGLAGLWTKADSVTCFDNLKIESLDQNPK
jgi:hypothetical protein